MRFFKWEIIKLSKYDKIKNDRLFMLKTFEYLRDSMFYLREYDWIPPQDFDLLLDRKLSGLISSINKLIEENRLLQLAVKRLGKENEELKQRIDEMKGKPTND